MQRIVAGVDGCGSERLAVVQGDRGMDARIVPHLEALLDSLPDVLIGIDIPIGLPNQGSLTCDVLARKLLGRPRQSSVFPAPIRACLKEGSHRTLSALHRRTDGRGLTIQAFIYCQRSGRLMICFRGPAFPTAFVKCTRRSPSRSGTTDSRCASTRRSPRVGESANASSIVNGPANEHAWLDSSEEADMRRMI